MQNKVYFSINKFFKLKHFDLFLDYFYQTNTIKELVVTHGDRDIPTLYTYITFKEKYPNKKLLLTL